MVHDKRLAAKFVCDLYEKKNDITCTRCKCSEYYVINTGYLRCVECRTDYNPFTDTWIGWIGISTTRWLVLIHLFNLEISARAAATESGVSYPVVLDAFNLMRYTITKQLAETDNLLRGRIEADGAYFGGKRKGNRGRGAKNKVVVFGIREYAGRVQVTVVKNARASTLTRNTVKMVKKESIVYTDRWHGYDTLVMIGYKHKSVNHSKFFREGDVHINGIEGFWSYAKERLAKHHGIHRDKFVYYIKELEWRYNNQDKDLDLVLLGYILERMS